MKLFEVQTKLTSYRYPIAKIVVCIVLIVLCLCRNSIFPAPPEWVNVVLSVVCFGITIPAILCIYISVGELFHTYSNRRNAARKKKDT